MQFPTQTKDGGCYWVQVEAQPVLEDGRPVRFVSVERDITSQRAQMDWFVIGDRADPRTPVTWTRSMATRAGTGKLHEVDGPVGE